VLAGWLTTTWTTKTHRQVPPVSIVAVGSNLTPAWKDPSAADGGYGSARVNCSLAAGHRWTVKSGTEPVVATT